MYDQKNGLPSGLDAGGSVLIWVQDGAAAVTTWDCMMPVHQAIGATQEDVTMTNSGYNAYHGENIILNVGNEVKEQTDPRRSRLKPSP